MVNWYYQNHGVMIDEIRLHKLLYFIQKENYKLFNEPAFDEDFVGWVHGPVSLDVRHNIDKIVKRECTNLELREVLANVYERYGKCSVEELIQETHNEVPWLKSRKNHFKNDIGSTVILKSDISESVIDNEPFDEIWGMRYEDHETYNE
ncbi:MAG: DUF4065 domain-containing protein [Erysipelotrichales bacterium]|nr:DUF4065 domain-containing protein [Erysipelotrichales bacterium]